MQFTTSALLLFTLLPLGLAAPAATSASASASKAAGKATGASSSAAKSTSATASASAAKASAGADASGASASGNTTSTGGTSASGAANGISDIQVGNAVMSWMNDTAKVTKFLNTAASLSGDDFTKQATIALNAEKDELNHKKVLDDAFSSMPSVMSANDVLATQGTFQKVVDALAQMVSDGPDTAQAMVDAINANRCVNVLPNIDAYFAAAGSASVMSARPTGCLEVANAVASPAAGGASGNASTGASGASGAGAAGAASGASSSSASSSVTSAASKSTGAASKATGSASKATGAAAKATGGAAAKAASKSTGAAKAAAKATAA